jgi:cell pole-organizing protein PopZ
MRPASDAIYYKYLRSIYKKAGASNTRFTRKRFNSSRSFIQKGIPMIVTRFNLRRMLAALAIGATLMSGLALPASAAAPSPSAADQGRQEWIRHRQQQLKVRLAKMAERLEIKSSQQAAWQIYASAYEAMMERPAGKPETNTDAASLARMRADGAAEHARRLAQIADATARLQQVLTPDQRKTLDQMAQHFSRHGHRWGPHGQRGGNGGQRPH